MSNFSISVKDYKEPIVIEKDFNEQNFVLEIKCDGVVDNNSFAVNYDGDEGMTIQRNRCKLNIHLDRNYKNWERNYHIWLTHVNDEYVRVDINIIQGKEIFSIEHVDDQKLSSEIQEEEPINVTVNGGSQKFNIIEIAKIHFTENVESITVNDVKYEYKTFVEENGKIKYKWVNGNNTVYTSMRNPSKTDKTRRGSSITDVEYESVRQPFDNGFELLKNDNTITITSYGRPFLEEDDYYEIVLQHADDINVKQTIKVGYLPLTKTENTETQETTARIEDTIDTPVEIPNTEVLEEEEVIEVQPPVYKILFNEDLDNLVINNVERMVIPFRVTEDGKETNLMAAANASANWCLTEIEQRYNSAGRIVRNLIINIRNRPISERKSSVSVYIFDIPNVNVNFVLTNKPSF